jgi:choice-of-anchor C domain-containing protein
MRLFWPLAAIALFLGAADQVRASLITNGSFEMANANPGGSFLTLGSGSTTITSWKVGGNSIDYIGGYWQPSDGMRSLDMSGNAAGSISQTFTTTANTTYKVLFDLAGNPDGGPTVKHLNVSAAASSQNYMFNTTGHSRVSMGWMTDSFVFKATGPSTTLTFTSQDNTPFGPALDNVRAAAVPEPASLTLLGLGVAGIVGFHLRRKRASKHA